MKTLLMIALVAALLASAAAQPGKKSENLILQQLLTRNQAETDPAETREEHPRPAWRARRAHLSEDEREVMTKQIMQAISEMMSSDCMTDRDYQGWVDFGRREAE